MAVQGIGALVKGGVTAAKAAKAGVTTAKGVKAGVTTAKGVKAGATVAKGAKGAKKGWKAGKALRKSNRALKKTAKVAKKSAKQTEKLAKSGGEKGLKGLVNRVDTFSKDNEQAIKYGKTGLNALKSAKGRNASENTAGASPTDNEQTGHLAGLRGMARDADAGSEMDRLRTRQTANMLLKQKLSSGSRSVADVGQFVSDIEGKIATASAAQKLDLQKEIGSQQDNISSRKMDLIELDAARKRAQGAADQDVGGKNMYANAAKAGDIIADTRLKRKNAGKVGDALAKTAANLKSNSNKKKNIWDTMKLGKK